MQLSVAITAQESNHNSSDSEALEYKYNWKSGKTKVIKCKYQAELKCAVLAIP